MDDHLQKLTKELRSAKCPPAVLTRVRDQIAREEEQRSPAVALAVLGGLAVILLTALIISFPPTPKDDVLVAQSVAEPNEINTSQVANEVTLSLACIGQVLLDAGNSSEAVLRKEVFPPLQRSLVTIQTTLKNAKGTEL